MGGCPRRLNFGLSPRTEFARFTRTLESNFGPSSGKILFKLSSSMRDDYIFISWVVEIYILETRMYVNIHP